jgi:hypothetical protein
VRWPGPPPGGGRAFGQGREQRIDAHGFALGGDDLAQGARRGSGHLDGHLVGFQLTQHLVGRDGLARFLEPCGDGRLGDAFSERWHANFNGHGRLPFDGQRIVHERGLLCFVLAGEARRGRGACRRPA